MEHIGRSWRVPAIAVVAVCLAVLRAAAQSGAQVTPQAPTVPTITVSGAARPAGTAALSGVVADAVTGRPVAGAAVILSNLDKATDARRVLTDSRGRFVFLDLPASAAYYLGAERLGYAYTRLGWNAPGGSLAVNDISRIALTDGQWRRDVRIPLWRWGAISGAVRDERGEPVAGVVVRAFKETIVSGVSYQVGGPMAITDDRGAYRLAGVSPGRYVVGVLSVQSTVLTTTPDRPQARATGALEEGGLAGGKGSWVTGPTIDVSERHRLALTNVVTPPPAAPGSAHAYPHLFFPGTVSSADARAIEIQYGRSLTGIDFDLQPVPAFRVSGRVEPSTGALPRLLRLMPAGMESLGFGSEAATTLVERDGRFTFLNVPSGRYTLLAQASVIEFTTTSGFPRVPEAPGFPGGGAGVGALPGVPGLTYLARLGSPSTFWSRMSLDVGLADLDDVVVALRRTATVRGRIDFAEGTRRPPPDTRIEFNLEPASGDPTFGQFMVHTDRSDPTLAFTADGLMGTTYLMGPIYPHAAGTTIATPGAYHVASVMYRGRDIKETGFDASVETVFDDVVVTLTDKRIDLSGVVEGSAGPAATSVIVFPFERDRWTNFGWRPARIRSVRSSSGGAFRLDGLPAGEYYVIAVPLMEPAEWMNPAFFAAAAPRATRLSVVWGEAPTLTLRLVDVRKP